LSSLETDWILSENTQNKKCAEKQNLSVVSVPLLALVNALLNEILQFLKIAESPDTIVPPLETTDPLLNVFELHRLAPIMREMLPPKT
jgi:hypothetical protein